MKPLHVYYIIIYMAPVGHDLVKGLGKSSHGYATKLGLFGICPAVGVPLGNQRPWYVQPCLCDWVIKGLGMSSRVCVTG